MKILMISAEAVPFAKTGGLADAVSAMAITLTNMGHDVKIVIPRYYKIDRNKLKKLDEGEENIKYLTKEEVEKIKAVLEEDDYKKFKNLVYVTLYTGFRISNINYMRWEWIDINNRLIIIPGKCHKSGKKLEHPINDELYEIFVNIGIKKRGYVFLREETGKPYTNPQRDIINKIFDKAGVEANGFHIIRHTVATTLAENNASEFEIQTFLHHEDFRTSRKYIHSKPSMLKNCCNYL